jgi:hypothetical protein
MTKAVKLSISVPAALAEEVRARVGERGVSAFFASAATRHLKAQRLLALLDDLDDEVGPPDAAELDAARAIMLDPFQPPGNPSANSPRSR